MISTRSHRVGEAGAGRRWRPAPASPTNIAGAPVRRASSAPSLRITDETWLVQTQPGLEAIAFEEVAMRYALVEAAGNSPSRMGDARRAGDNRTVAPLVRRTSHSSLPSAVELGRRVVPGRAGMCLFTAPRIEPLQKLRCTEDLFGVAGYSRCYGTKEAALERIRGAARAAPYVESALRARVKLTPGSRSGARLKFRVIARIVGEQEFRRAEFKRAVERGITERGDRSWKLEEDNAEVEFWATLIHDELFLALRLSDEHLRHRDYKAAHIPGSLRPSVAAALGILSSPQPDDLVLDPFCGAGTVLIERAHLARYQLLIGGDTDHVALDAARLNIGPRYKPLELHPWDATAVPMPNQSVSRIITNLPWGMQHGSHADNRRLYPLVFNEFARLLTPKGIAVMLTGEQRLISDLLRHGVLRATRIIRVSILGMAAAIYVCRKTN